MISQKISLIVLPIFFFYSLAKGVIWEYFQFTEQLQFSLPAGALFQDQPSSFSFFFLGHIHNFADVQNF